MPGNEVGDRVHNFFAQDNLSQSQNQNQSQVVEGNWPVLNNNLWVGNQRQIGVQSSNQKNYSLHQSDLERGHGSHPSHVPHGLHFTQSTLRPEFTNSQSQSQQPNLNGYMYQRQVFQTRQDEADLLGVDTESDRHKLNPRGLSMYGLQQESGPEHHTKTPARSETSESPVSFDFFGGQQQMTGRNPGMLQSLPQHQQSGFNDMQQLQQEAMLRKMQELQRQKELGQLDARQQNSANQTPFLINGTQFSDAPNYPWATEPGNTILRQRASPAMQGSSSGLVFSSDQGQAPYSMGSVHQQVDQSLYGVPISSSRGGLKQYQHIATEKPSPQQMSTFNTSFPGNQYAIFQEQGTMQDGTVTSRHGFQGKNVAGPGHASDQGLGGGLNMENFQQVNSMHRNALVHEFQGRPELVGQSEIGQEKTTFEAASSQGEVALDPTEEKILFGSDDNIWDAFGKSTNMSGETSNLLDGIGFLDGAPSLQSGSWSALMQSAVGETSSSDNGIQEEWTGLTFQNTEHSTENHQPSTFNDSGKRQTTLGDGNSQIAPALNFGYAPLSEDANMNNNYNNPRGFQQFERKTSYEHSERLQINSSQRPAPHQSSGGGSKWLTHSPLQKPLTEGNQIYGNSSLSVDGEMNAKNISSHWTPQQSGYSQPFGKPSSWNVMGSASPGGDASLNIRENGYPLQNSRSNEQKRVIHEEPSHSDGIWKATAPNSTVEMEPLKSNMGSSQVNKEGYSLKNAQNSSTMRTGEEPSQFLQNHHLNYWKNVDSMARSKGSELETCNKKENSNDSYHSNTSQHTSTGGLRDIVLSDASDSRNLPSGKQKGGQVGRKPSGPHKFQYHPMGNLDEDDEPSYGMRQTTQQISQGLKNQDQGYFGKSNHFSQVYNNSSETGKGKSPDLRGDTKGIDEVLSRGNLPGYISNRSAQLNRSAGLFAPNKASQPSQNMLELLHKVDQSKEHRSTMHFSSSEHNPSTEMPETENSEGSGGGCLQRSHSSASQGFGLQLAPPSQRLPVPNHPSHSSMQSVNPFSSTLAPHETRDNRVHAQLAPTTSVQSFFPSQQTSQGEFVNNRFSSGFPYSRSQLQNQNMCGARGQLATNQSANVSFDQQVSQSKPADDSCTKLTGQSAEASIPTAAENTPFENPTSSGNRTYERAHAPQNSAGEMLSVSEAFTTSRISQQGAFSNMWTNVPEARKVTSYLSQSHQSNVVESPSAAQNLEDQDERNRGNPAMEFGASSVNSQGLIHRDEQQAKTSPFQQASSGNPNLVQKVDESQGKEPANSALTTQRDIEAFGHSLKPNNLFHQSYSLLNQMRVMKNEETDPSNRGLKRLRGADNILDGHQQVSSRAAQPNELSTTDPSRDKMLSYSGPADNLERGNNESQNHSSGNNTASIRVEHCQISPQMAPSWFNQYGTFRNGQMLSVFDARKAATAKTLEQQPFALEKSFGGLHTLNSMEEVNVSVDTNQNGNSRQSSTPASVATEQLSSFKSFPSDVGGQNVLVLRPKKRKSATDDLCPWHKEISQGSQSLQTISMAEADWARAANRLTEKVEDDPETIEDGPPMLRPKRRLILTTQLMQQLIRPPPPAILSTDASSDYESAAHFVARLTLGDACSLVSSTSYSNVPSGGANLLSDNKTSERNDDKHLLDVVEGFMDRARKLENELLRLDKRASVSELKLECQDVETFSVINRFAKFHGRAKADRADTSAAANAQKPYPQRYVTAVPLPRNLPDRVHCLSL